MALTTLLLTLSLRHREKKHKFQHRLIAEGRRRRDKRIPRIALQLPYLSAWAKLYGSGSDQALISLTGFDHRSFRYILNNFATVYDRHTPYSIDGRIAVKRNSHLGRKRSMNASSCLGLSLAWYRTRGSIAILCLLFGITHSVCALFLRFARRILVKVLSASDMARVQMPTEREIRLFKSTITGRYSMLQHVYAVADGLKLTLEQSGDSIIQEMFYNGWTHSHYVSNVFVFAPNGVVIACVTNAPGAMHDSSIAECGNLYEKLEDVYEKTGGKVVVDSAFAKGQYPFLIKSAQDETEAQSADDVIRLRQATSVRQASEWGMRGFQGSFPRLKDRFLYEERGERKLMLWCTVLLFNLRTRLVGLNQILSTFMPRFSVEANLFIRDEFGI